MLCSYAETSNTSCHVNCANCNVFVCLLLHMVRSNTLHVYPLWTFNYAFWQHGLFSIDLSHTRYQYSVYLHFRACKCNMLCNKVMVIYYVGANDTHIPYILVLPHVSCMEFTWGNIHMLFKALTVKYNVYPNNWSFTNVMNFSEISWFQLSDL